MTNPSDNEQQGYRTPVEQYSEQDNQQGAEEINKGAHNEDQIEKLKENAPEGGRDAYPEKQAGSPPISDQDLDRGE